MVCSVNAKAYTFRSTLCSLVIQIYWIYILVQSNDYEIGFNFLIFFHFPIISPLKVPVFILIEILF
jgi:hypothetical protein